MKEVSQIIDNNSLAETYNINLDDFNDFLISTEYFSVRTTNCLLKNNIKSIKSLLQVSLKELVNIKGFGKSCIIEMENFCENIERILINKKKEVNQIFFEHLIDIANEDFSFLENRDLSTTEVKEINNIKKIIKVLGEELIFSLGRKDPYLLGISYELINSLKVTKYHLKIQELLKKIPESKNNNAIEPYINTYTIDEELRNFLKGMIKNSNESFKKIYENLEFGNEKAVKIFYDFLKWSNFNLKDEIEQIFSGLYKNNREKMVIEYRSKNKTLNEIGNYIGITRERVRQIESKVKNRFYFIQKKFHIISKISAERNGDTILTFSEIEEYAGKNAEVLIFLLKDIESVSYTYDKQLDVFIVGNDTIKEQAEKYMERLPELIPEEKLPLIIKEAYEFEELPTEIVEKVFLETYKLTGAVYHRNRLTINSICQEILKKYYQAGIRVYDPVEIKKFREIVKEEYGGVNLPVNDRALSVRIVEPCILCDRGKYKLKQKKYISKELANEIVTYIDKSENMIFMTNTIFSIFEKELLLEGITNKYYLQGILRELFLEKYTFTRDYISKDSSITSVYSSIVNYVKSFKYPVSKKQIQSEFVGVTEIVYNLSLTDENILNYFGEFFHASNLKISGEEKEYLHNFLENILSDNQAHHNKEIYKIINSYSPEIFTRNFALFQHSAFSILEYLFRDEFQFSRPYIAKKGIEILTATERLYDIIYSQDEILIEDIKKFAQENYANIYSRLEFINSCNDEFLLISSKKMKRITLIDVNEEIALKIEKIILNNLNGTKAIRELKIWNELPFLGVPWTDWLLYSVIKKWGKNLEVAVSSNEFRYSIPLVAPLGDMSISEFDNITDKKEFIPLDMIDEIDELLDDDFLLEEIDEEL